MNSKLKVRILEIFRTQYDFARAIGVNESTVSRVIRERKRLSQQDREKWSNALKCKTDDLWDLGSATSKDGV